MTFRRRVKRLEVSAHDLDLYVQGICQEVERARQRCGLTYLELAERSGVSERQITYVLTGKGNPTVRTLFLLAWSLDLHVAVFRTMHKHRGLIVGLPVDAQRPLRRRKRR